MPKLNPDAPTPLVLATGNRHKLAEVAALLAGSGLSVAAAPQGFAVDEDGLTFADNAAKKAHALRAQLAVAGAPHPWVLADDSGLVVPALGGAPGVRSARYAPAAADQDAANRALLLERMATLTGDARRAHFVCALACIDGDGHLMHVSGAVHGHIAVGEAGHGGFGYDSLFVPQGHAQTFAQAPPGVKAALSHRAQAVAQLQRLLAATQEI